MASGGPHGSANQGGQSTGGPHHRHPALASRFQEASLSRFGVPHLLQLSREDPYAPPYKYERGARIRTHTSHTPPLILHLELGVLPRSLGSLGGQGEMSEEKPGEVPGLSALFSAFTLTDAYQSVSSQSVSVHDYLNFIIYFTSSCY